MLSQQLVGTWRLVSRETRRPDGHVPYFCGEHPVGQLMYDAAGNMSVAFMRRGRSQFAGADKSQCTPAEIKEAFDGFQSYFGTYEIDEEKKTVTHHVRWEFVPELGRDEPDPIGRTFRQSLDVEHAADSRWRWDGYCRPGVGPESLNLALSLGTFQAISCQPPCPAGRVTQRSR